MEEIKPEQKESIKLMRMSKGYQWEIKLFIEDFDKKNILKRDEDGKDCLKRIKELDNSLRQIYTGDTDESD